MASSYTPLLRLVLPVAGELTGTWGDVVNAGLTNLVEQSIAGTATITIPDANYTLTTANEAADEARRAVINCTGSLSAQRNVVCPSSSKLYVVVNNTTGGFAINFTTAGGTGVLVPAGETRFVRCDGTNVVVAITPPVLPTISSFGASLIDDADAAAARTTLGAAASGPATTSGLTLPTATIAGRTTAGTGAIEALTVGANLTLLAGVLSAAGGTPAGAVATFATNAAPAGWLKANGALVSRTTYSSLFSVIGTTFGVGDGSTTFGLPDLRGEFIRGWDDGRGVDSGRVFGSAQAGEIQSHTHSTPTYAGYVNGGQIAGTANGGYFGNQATTATGGAETRPRNVALLACIKF